MKPASINEKFAVAEDQIVALIGATPTLARIATVLEIGLSWHRFAASEQVHLRRIRSKRKVFIAYPIQKVELENAMACLPAGLVDDVALRNEIATILSPFQIDESADVMRLVCRYTACNLLRLALQQSQSGP